MKIKNKTSRWYKNGSIKINQHPGIKNKINKCASHSNSTDNFNQKWNFTIFEKSRFALLCWRPNCVI